MNASEHLRLENRKIDARMPSWISDLESMDSSISFSKLVKSGRFLRYPWGTMFDPDGERSDVVYG